MFNHLQQRVLPTKNVSSRAAVTVSNIALDANINLLLVLALIIIPTIGGVLLIN